MSSPSPRLILAAFHLLGRLFPAPPLDREIIPSPEVLKEKSKRWNRISGVSFLSLFVACAISLGSIACKFADKHLAALGKPLFLIRAEPFELWVWAVFLATVLSAWLSFLILRVVLSRERYHEFIMVTSHASPMGGADGVTVHFGKVFCFFFFLAGPLLAALIVFRIDSYTAFTKDAMVINPMWSLGKEVVHPYKDIRGIYSVANFHARFNDVAKPRHAVVFADGTVWTTGDGMRAPRPESDSLFIQEIAKRSRRPVTALNFLEDAPK